MVVTVWLMDFALLWDGIPTRRSTSPTLMSWRRKSSSRKVSSANKVSNVGPRVYPEYLPLPPLSGEEYLKPAQTKPIGTGQESAGSIGPRFAGTDSRRTFRWGRFPCTAAGPAPQPAPTSKD